MPGMISLKRSEEEIAERKKDWELGPSANYFPVSLYLGTEEIEKLGLEDAEMGDERMLVARVRASEVSRREVADSDGIERSLTLEFVEAATEDVPAKKSVATRMYPDADEG